VRQVVLDRHRTRLVSDDRDLDRRRSDRQIVRSIGWFDAAGFPDDRTPRRRAIGALVAAAIAALLAITMVTLNPASHRDVSAFGAGDPPLTSAVPTVGAPTSTSRSTPASTPTIPVTRTVASHPTTPKATTTNRPPSSTSPVASSVSDKPAHVPSAPAPSTPAPSTPASTATLTPPTVTLTLNPTKYPAAQGGSGVLTLIVSGGPITWAATATGGMTLSPAKGSVAANGAAHAKLAVPASKPGAVATVTVRWATGSKTLSVTWS
jgi:hypothetical protein